jgi:hypothetical protein
MKTIKLINNKITIPKEFELTKTKRRLVIKTPYKVQIHQLDKYFLNENITYYFRIKGKHKPYVEEGYIIIDKEKFKIENYINRIT